MTNCNQLPIFLQSEIELLTPQDAKHLWEETIAYAHHADDEVTARFVTEIESKKLNKEYRKKDKATNVLTFSYGEGTHDIALCLPVAEREASERQVGLREYVALLLVHAFLHAVGFDHERSEEEAKATSVAEQEILARAGFATAHLE